jgi:hypothetical protein
MTRVESPGGTLTTAPLVVVGTFYCTPREATPHYEVHLAPDLGAPNPLVFVTVDEALYQDALDAEATAQRFVATWHAEDRRRVLDRLEAAP